MNQQQLREIFDYRAETGELVWKSRTSNRIRIGDVAGSKSKLNGYIEVRIKGKLYQGHRLVWVYVNGDIPDGLLIDHVDENRSNNRIENLRLATKAQNMMNRGAQKNNSLGIKGIDIVGKRFRVQVAGNGKRAYGMFDDIQEAEQFAMSAREVLHKEYHNHG
jgi:hypothetical protein